LKGAASSITSFGSIALEGQQPGSFGSAKATALNSRRNRCLYPPTFIAWKSASVQARRPESGFSRVSGPSAWAQDDEINEYRSTSRQHMGLGGRAQKKRPRIVIGNCVVCSSTPLPNSAYDLASRRNLPVRSRRLHFNLRVCGTHTLGR
jgi:hypothetical protein